MKLLQAPGGKVQLVQFAGENVEPSLIGNFIPGVEAEGFLGALNHREPRPDHGYYLFDDKGKCIGGPKNGNVVDLPLLDTVAVSPVAPGKTIADKAA